jgi:signal transduction histidine kinase
VLWASGWLVAILILGEVTRHRRAYLQEARQRALEAERVREEAALRRVDEERLRIAQELHDTLTHAPVVEGHGLRGMRERASALGGTLTVGPKPGGGFRVHATLPLAGESGEAENAADPGAARGRSAAHPCRLPRPARRGRRHRGRR